MSRRGIASLLAVVVLLIVGIVIALRVTPPGSNLPEETRSPPSTTPRELPPATSSTSSGAAPAEPRPGTAEVPRNLGYVVGTVVDAGGCPVPGAKVHDGAQPAIVSEDGSFRSRPIGPGELVLSAAAPGHPPVTARAVVEPGRETRVEMVLVPGGLTIAGRVIDENGAPIAGARIHVFSDPPGELEVLRHLGWPRTGPDGAFHLDGLPPGTYGVGAGAPRRSSASRRGVEAGRNDLELVLRLTGTLEGVVVDEEGSAETGLTTCYSVRSLDRDEPGVWWQTLGEDGIREKVEPGRYEIWARTADGRIGKTDVDVKLGEVARFEVRLADDGLEIAGTVVSNATGKPVAGALVAALEGNALQHLVWIMEDAKSAAINGAVATSTDEKGRYRLRGLTAGLWTVAVRTSGFRAAVVTEVKLPGPGPVLRLTPAGAIELTVTGDDGEPARQAMAWVDIDPSGKETIDADVDEETGRVLLESLPTGTHEVGVQIGYGPTRWFAILRVPVTAGDTARVTVEPPPPGCRLEGRITRAGRPAIGRQVRVESAGADGVRYERVTTTDAEGRYALDRLAPGPGRFSLGRHGEENGRDVRLATGETVLDIELSPLSLRLILVDAVTGKTVSGTAHAVGRTSWPDEIGRLVLEEIPEGKTEVTVRASGYGPARRMLAPAESPDEVRIPMIRAVRTTIRVTDESGSPVRSPEIHLVDASGWDLTFEAEDHFRGSSTAGRRVFELAPGAYALRVSAAGFRPHAATVVVPAPGGEIRIRLASE